MPFLLELSKPKQPPFSLNVFFLDLIGALKLAPTLTQVQKRAQLVGDNFPKEEVKEHQQRGTSRCFASSMFLKKLYNQNISLNLMP